MKKRLTEAQFQAAIKGLEIGQQTIDIARGVLVDGRPQAEGWAWLKYEDDGQEFEADLGTVQLVALLEG